MVMGCGVVLDLVVAVCCKWCVEEFMGCTLRAVPGPVWLLDWNCDDVAG